MLFSNLRGGIGKTSLAFNLSFLANNALIVDTCPQGNLSYFFNKDYQLSPSLSVNDILRPYFLPGFGFATNTSQYIAETNKFFEGKNNYFIKSSNELYILPSQMANALVQARTIMGSAQEEMIDKMLYSLKSEIQKEKQIINADKCLIDTSPFFSGATHLAWHATDALIIPVRTDQQSINSLRLLLDILTNPNSEFRRTPTSDNHTPKIQMIVLTHCGWSTVAGARNIPNQQTKMFLKEIYNLIARQISLFTTSNPANHIVMLDDFLGSGRMSTAQSKPILCMNSGETMYINRVKTSVNESVYKIQNELKFIHNSIW
ncbi:ParA family protein [Neisseria chenwenguii]|uniref:ParA family protein n=1 Tax=Neisseria chenwenguii TaxID=1853278 RepID=UPI0022790DC8|nr:ParA family protein [Neisseria chenwenguii]